MDGIYQNPNWAAYRNDLVSGILDDHYMQWIAYVDGNLFQVKDRVQASMTELGILELLLQKGVTEKNNVMIKHVGADLEVRDVPTPIYIY